VDVVEHRDADDAPAFRDAVLLHCGVRPSNIQMIFDAGHSNGHPYAVMELLDQCAGGVTTVIVAVVCPTPPSLSLTERRTV
jgi:hypothetical protein